MNSLIFTVSKTFTEVTPESAEHGDFSDNGFVYQDQPMSFRELIRELQDCVHLSSGPIRRPQDCHTGMWAETDYSIVDYSTATEQNEAVHISEVNGKPIKPAQLWRLFRAAGLI